MIEHTPGPWKAIYVGCGDWDLNGPVTQEDWVLAASAPDLLNALKRALDVIEGEYPKDQYELYGVSKMHAAIAKATGETK